MTLADLDGSIEQTISLIFTCSSCNYQVGMLTNPFETQMLKSMDVELGSGEAAASDESAESKCPIAGMLRDKEATGIPTAVQGTDDPASGPPADDGNGGAPLWTDEAAERLQNIPSFVRPMAKRGIEEFARQRGHRRITAAVMDEARSQFGM